METGGILRVAVMAVALLACGAAGATDYGDIGNMTPEQAANGAVQQAVVDSLVGTGRFAPAQAQTLMVGSSSGTYMPAVASVIGPGGQAQYATATANQKKLHDNLAALWNVNPATVTDPNAFMGAHEVANGLAAAGPVQVASTAVQQIGGAGGLVSTRVAALREEQRGMIRKFGSNDAVASNIVNKDFCNRIWVSPFYVHERLGAKDGYRGHKYDAGGLGIGYDRVFGPITVGVAFTYSHGKYKEDDIQDNNKLDNYGASLYAQYYNQGGFTASVAGGYNYGKNDMSRYTTITPAIQGWQSGNNHTQSWWLGGDVGYEFKLGENFSATPTVGLFYATNKSSRYYSDGPLPMWVNSMKNRIFQVPLSLSLDYTTRFNECSSLKFTLAGGYAYDFKNEGVNGSIVYDYVNALPISVEGVAPGHHSWNIGAGIKYQYKRFDVGLGYRYDGRKSWDGHRASVLLGMNF